MIAKIFALVVLILGYYFLLTKYWYVLVQNIFNPMLALFIFLLPMIVAFGIAMIFGR